MNYNKYKRLKLIKETKKDIDKDIPDRRKIIGKLVTMKLRKER